MWSWLWSEKPATSVRFAPSAPIVAVQLCRVSRLVAGPGPTNQYREVRSLYPAPQSGSVSLVEVFVYLKQAAEHITDSASQEIRSNKGNVRVAVWCDNSRDLEMIWSSLGDFNLCGGLYRYVNLVMIRRFRSGAYTSKAKSRLARHRRA